MPKIKCPSDIYDELFDNILDEKWKFWQQGGTFNAFLRTTAMGDDVESIGHQVELVGRIIEFLENNLERWEVT